MLTGTNGILTQAQNAKQATEQASAKEKLELAVLAVISQSKTGELDSEELITEIKTNYRVTATKTENGFPVNATIDGINFAIDGINFAIDENGNIILRKALSEITGNETINTLSKDSLGNQVVVPAGFEVVNPNANVTDGIIIRDKTHTNTAGSEFVWIPVGDIETEDKGTVDIEIKRYVFNSDGTVNEELSKTEPVDLLKISSSSSYYFTEGLKDSTTENRHAKDIETFKTKAENSHGYYIGRYEAKTNTQRTAATTDDKLTQITTKPNDYVYNYVTQPQAAKLSRGMYTGAPFESDLINSYAWDTATLFLQTFDNRASKTKKLYSIQDSLNTESLANQGTNKLDASKQDVICNVWDMASNCWELTTETCSTGNPCTFRGGLYQNGAGCGTSNRGSYNISSSRSYISFRSILYL